MRNRTLILNDGRQMPQLGLGMSQVPDDEADGVIRSALEIGYRLMDGAVGYANENGIGRGVRDADIPREEVFVTSKLWNTDHGRDAALRAFDATMQRLQFDYLDLYMIHWPMLSLGLYVETWKALVELRQSGRVRSVGVCNFPKEHLQILIDETGETPAVNQIELHPAFSQKELRDLHHRLGIVTQSWSPLGRSKALEGAAIDGIAQRLSATPAQVVIAWHLAHGLSAIPKSRHPDRQRENFAASALQLTLDDIAAIDALETNARLGPNPADS